ncbi:hypothetical protein OnM2_087006 [Erysiphe neolycopersici]|uniref:Uncharacterized protein n=1 Tax=Erysiphe neolycopersici TaxID=212602 RepID=A0A420HEA0_9PEZI|nr:hypothetical protein OnM2_087006 [Erysiphe neolycopersici]
MMANNRTCSEFKDFALETYRHASRYGDSPCERPFLPRRGIFFWPMEKSTFDHRRFVLWIRVLQRMEKDKILISIEEPSQSIDIRDTRYHFHPNQYRPPFYKAHKLRWPHVKEWYFEFMNSKNESMLLNHSMSRLEAYLDSRDRKDGIKNDTTTSVSNFLSRTQNPTRIVKFPLVKRKSAEEIHAKYPKDSSYYNVESPNCSETSSLYVPGLSTAINSHSIMESPNHGTDKKTSATVKEERAPSVKEYLNRGVVTCTGCSRCAYRDEYPDDLFEGRVHPCLEKDQSQRECEYIICHECKKLFDDAEIDSFKKHLESPEHTRNYLLRLRKSGNSPTKTLSNKKRLVNLSRYTTHMGYASVSDYISKSTLEPKNQEKIPLPLSYDDSSNSHSKTKDQAIEEDFSKAQPQKPKENSSENPSVTLRSEAEIFSAPSAKDENLPSSDSPNVEKDLSDFLTKQKDSPSVPLMLDEMPNIPPMDNDLLNMDPSDGEELHDTFLDNLDQSDDMLENIKTLHLRQRKSDKRLVKAEANISNTKTSLNELSRQVEISVNRTQALIRSFLRHDDAIKLLQKDAMQGKAITDMMEGAIDAMTGTVKSEVVTNRLDRHETDIVALRRELKNKVDDLSCWLKVIDRHTNDINTLKQRVWINGQINDSGETNRHLVQKLEYQIRIQQEATKVFMMNTEHRFDALVRQYTKEINKLIEMDEEKQRQIMHLKSQMGLKFAHMEQKAASLRKSRR